MSTLQEKLAEYKKKGAAELNDGFAPTLVLTNDEGKETFVEGKLVSRQMVKTVNGQKPVYNMELISTDCEAQVKEKKGYVTIPVNPGEIVGFFAPNRLDRVLIRCKQGDQMVVVYNGREDKAKARGRNPAHLFTVHNLGGGTNPIVSAAEAAAVAAQGNEEEF